MNQMTDPEIINVLMAWIDKKPIEVLVATTTGTKWTQWPEENGPPRDFVHVKWRIAPNPQKCILEVLSEKETGKVLIRLVCSQHGEVCKLTVPEMSLSPSGLGAVLAALAEKAEKHLDSEARK